MTFKDLPKDKQEKVKKFIRDRYPYYQFIHNAKNQVYRGDTHGGSDADFVELSVIDLFDLVSELMIE